jgi:hypothetical protein
MLNSVLTDVVLHTATRDSNGDFTGSGVTFQVVDGNLQMTRTDAFAIGSKDLKIAYTDALGNSSNTAFTVKIDNVPPVGEISGMSVDADDTTTVIGTIADASGYGMSTITLVIKDDSGTTVATKQIDTTGISSDTATPTAWSVSISGLDVSGDKDYTMTFTAVDLAGNTLETTKDLLFMATPGLDLLEASDSGRKEDDDITNDTSMSFTVSALGDQTKYVSIYVDGDPDAIEIARFVRDYNTATSSYKETFSLDRYNDTVISDETLTVAGTLTDGKLEVTLDLDMSDDTYDFGIIAEDMNGNTADSADATNGLLTVKLDTTAPVQPGFPTIIIGTETVNSVTQDVAATVENGVAIVKNTTPTFKGTVEANADVEIFYLDADGNSVVIVAGISGDDGSFALTPAAAMADDVTLYMRVTDTAGNVSTASTGVEVIQDNEAPSILEMSIYGDNDRDENAVKELLTAEDNVVYTRDALPTVSGYIDDKYATVKVTIGGQEITATIDATTTKTFTVGTTTVTGYLFTATVSEQALADNSYTVTAAAEDIFGNSEAYTHGDSLRVDTTGPVITAEDFTINTLTPSLTFGVSDAYRVDSVSLTVQDRNALQKDFGDVTGWPDGTVTVTLEADDGQGGTETYVFEAEYDADTQTLLDGSSDAFTLDGTTLSFAVPTDSVIIDGTYTITAVANGVSTAVNNLTVSSDTYTVGDGIVYDSDTSTYTASIPASDELTEGNDYAVYINAIDGLGNPSTTKSADIIMNLDMLDAPAAPVLFDDDLTDSDLVDGNSTSDTTPALRVTLAQGYTLEAGQTLSLVYETTVDDVTTTHYIAMSEQADGTYTAAYPDGLAEGSYNVKSVVLDGTGDEISLRSSTYTFNIDLQASVATVTLIDDSAPDGVDASSSYLSDNVTNDSTPTYLVSGADFSEVASISLKVIQVVNGANVEQISATTAIDHENNTLSNAAFSFDSNGDVVFSSTTELLGQAAKVVVAITDTLGNTTYINGDGDTVAAATELAFSVDTEEPEVSAAASYSSETLATTLSGGIDDGEAYRVTVTLVSRDDDTDTHTYTYIKGAADNTVTLTETNGVYSWSLDTGDLTDATVYDISVTAEDEAGNVSETVTSWLKVDTNMQEAPEVPVLVSASSYDRVADDGVDPDTTSDKTADFEVTQPAGFTMPEGLSLYLSVQVPSTDGTGSAAYTVKMTLKADTTYEASVPKELLDNVTDGYSVTAMFASEDALDYVRITEAEGVKALDAISGSAFDAEGIDTVSVVITDSGDNEVRSATATVNSDGTWDAAISDITAAGAYTVTVTMTDGAGNEKTDVTTITVNPSLDDTAVPGAPIVYDETNAPTTQTEGDKPTFTVMAETGREVMIVVDGAAYAMTETADAGVYTYTPGVSLDHGIQSVYAYYGDGSGVQASTASAVTQITVAEAYSVIAPDELYSPKSETTVYIDTTVDQPTLALLNDTAPQGVVGDDDDTTDDYMLSDKLVNDASPSFVIGNINLADLNQLSVTITDGTDTEAVTTTYDAAAQTFNKPGFSLDSNGDVIYTAQSTLTDGNWSIDVSVTDLGGNTASASSALAFSVDTNENGELDTDQDSYIFRETTPTVTGTVEDDNDVYTMEATFTLRNSSVNPAPSYTYEISFNETDGTWSVSVPSTAPLADISSYDMVITMTDEAGNIRTLDPVQVDIDTTIPQQPTQPYLATDTYPDDTTVDAYMSDGYTKDDTPTFYVDTYEDLAAGQTMYLYVTEDEGAQTAFSEDSRYAMVKMGTYTDEQGETFYRYAATIPADEALAVDSDTSIGNYAVAAAVENSADRLGDMSDATTITVDTSAHQILSFDLTSDSGVAGIDETFTDNKTKGDAEGDLTFDFVVKDGEDAYALFNVFQDYVLVGSVEIDASGTPSSTAEGMGVTKSTGTWTALNVANANDGDTVSIYDDQNTLIAENLALIEQSDGTWTAEYQGVLDSALTYTFMQVDTQTPPVTTVVVPAATEFSVTAYSIEIDRDLVPDGKHDYQVQAIDKAGNEADVFDKLEVIVDRVKADQTISSIIGSTDFKPDNISGLVTDKPEQFASGIAEISVTISERSIDIPDGQTALTYTYTMSNEEISLADNGVWKLDSTKMTALTDNETAGKYYVMTTEVYDNAGNVRISTTQLYIDSDMGAAPIKLDLADTSDTAALNLNNLTVTEFKSDNLTKADTWEISFYALSTQTSATLKVTNSSNTVLKYDATATTTTFSNSNGTYVKYTVSVDVSNWKDGVYSLSAFSVDGDGAKTLDSDPMYIQRKTKITGAGLNIPAEFDSGVMDNDNVANDDDLLLTLVDGIDSTTYRIDVYGVVNGVYTLIGTTLYDGTAEIGSRTDNLLFSEDKFGNVLFRQSNLPDGTVSYAVKLTDKAGNVSEYSDILSVTIDTVKPATPSISLSQTSDDHVVDAYDADNITKENSVSFEIGVTSEIGRIFVNLDGVLLGSSDVFFNVADGDSYADSYFSDSQFAWKDDTKSTVVFTPTEELVGNATYSLTAAVEDIAGNRSDLSAATEIHIDDAAPSATINKTAYDANEHATSDPKPLLNGSASDSNTTYTPEIVKIEVTITGSQSSTGTTYTYVKGAADNTLAYDETSDKWSMIRSLMKPLEGDTYTISMTATDVAGNTASDTHTILIDPSLVPGPMASPTLDWGEDTGPDDDFVNYSDDETTSQRGDALTNELTPVIAGNAKSVKVDPDTGLPMYDQNGDPTAYDLNTNSTVRLTITDSDGETVGYWDVTTDASGDYELTIASGVLDADSDGESYTVIAQLLNAAEELSTSSPAYTFILDSGTAQAEVSLESEDTGASDTDGIINDVSQIVAVKLDEDFHSVTVTDKLTGETLATFTVNNDPDTMADTPYSVTFPSTVSSSIADSNAVSATYANGALYLDMGLVDGEYDLRATVTDKAGNTSVQSAEFLLAVDTVNPDVATVSDVTMQSVSPTSLITGSVADNTDGSGIDSVTYSVYSTKKALETEYEIVRDADGDYVSDPGVIEIYHSGSPETLVATVAYDETDDIFTIVVVEDNGVVSGLEAVFKPLTDASGNIVYDAQGNITYSDTLQLVYVEEAEATLSASVAVDGVNTTYNEALVKDALIDSEVIDGENIELGTFIIGQGALDLPENNGDVQKKYVTETVTTDIAGNTSVAYSTLTIEPTPETQDPTDDTPTDDTPTDDTPTDDNNSPASAGTLTLASEDTDINDNSEETTFDNNESPLGHDDNRTSDTTPVISGALSDLYDYQYNDTTLETQIDYLLLRSGTNAYYIGLNETAAKQAVSGTYGVATATVESHDELNSYDDGGVNVRTETTTHTFTATDGSYSYAVDVVKTYVYAYDSTTDTAEWTEQSYAARWALNMNTALSQGVYATTVQVVNQDASVSKTSDALMMLIDTTSEKPTVTLASESGHDAIEDSDTDTDNVTNPMEIALEFTNIESDNGVIEIWNTPEGTSTAELLVRALYNADSDRYIVTVGGAYVKRCFRPCDDHEERCNIAALFGF